LRTRYCCFILLALSLVFYGNPFITQHGLLLMQQRLNGGFSQVLQRMLLKRNDAAYTPILCHLYDE
jgi:hypothetical protein